MDKTELEAMLYRKMRTEYYNHDRNCKCDYCRIFIKLYSEIAIELLIKDKLDK